MNKILGEKVVRFDFGEPGVKPRALIGRHRHIAEAIRLSGKPMTELLSDQWGGWPFLIVALLRTKWDDKVEKKALTPAVASDLLETYVLAHQGEKPMETVGLALLDALSPYMAIEQTKPDSEDSDAPNGDTPDAPGPSAG